ncbi:hypothetical protein ENSA5_07700 [Enhygromyxa salina]|uniref:Uncharacterized protein n=1 Tax=Enhygromyxa salina TaxID=215803 RepID=A0A2S9YH53_9BACT|nr:hypothetical protein [Enhygromyxa salina]PRQ04434.1 hypothetical protein ENSA5_07700 [Enhygromyxa salina]
MPALWFASLLFVSPPEQARPGLVVDADPCLELDDAQLRETIEHQLGAGPDYRGDAAGQAGDTQILLDCRGAGEVELTIVDPITGTDTTRTVALPEAGRRGEQLGWAAAALLRATWMSLALDPATRADDPASRRAARVAQRPPSPWQLGDGFVVRSLFDGGSPGLMLGEQVEVVHRPRRHLAWKADGELAYWRVPVTAEGSSGRVNTLSVSAAPALLAWGEFPGRGRRGAGTLAIYGGAGLRAGGVRMRSETFGDSGGFVAFAGPMTTARLSVSLGRFVRLAVNAEAGWILHGPERPGGVPLSFVGPWANGVVVIVSSF